jgi:type I restriction enzyme R subunit
MTEKKTRTYSQDNIHRENVLQYHIIDQLIKNQGYLQRTTDDFDRATALDKALVMRFIKDTQAEEWMRLEEQYAAAAETEFFKQLEKAIKQRGTLDVLRQGIKLIPGIKFSLCFFKPASGLNEDLLKLYNTNILSVIDELKYSLKNDNRIDIGLFVNGIPLATLECKNQSTGSTFRHAEKQYRIDRSPAGELLLTFKQGALVHFALDEDNVSMTTRLANGKTRFLPFNRGRDGGAGNPDIDGEFRVAYLYADQPECKAIFSRDILLDIVGRFVHLDSTDGKEVMIFPRFQQLDAVLTMIGHAKKFGSGRSYLVQHSAGSGKSNTIGWTAHRLITLHDDADQPVFNTAIIVTDRVVLDRQLQNTVAQFEQTKGVVKKIDGTSRQLKEAMQQGARIIITTIHKFSTDHLKEISGQGGRRFAVLIDEAHGSQSGKHADNLSKTLTRDETDNSASDVEDLIADYQRQRGPQGNVSYFAFTATPRNVTLERFGSKGADGLPKPFHLYSMRQAIEEGFILDVLQNYMTYKTYYKLEKSIEDDPELSGRKAQRRVARFASLHPTSIAQKVEVIVEHFRRHVLKELDGQAKAMVVTQSREHALKYFFSIKKYIEDNKYAGVKALVAFSGELDMDGEIFTESGVNGFAETELPDQFDGPMYQLLIVAEKYQTGFDQPKLCAMYVDRKLDGLQAVQTLSRLNRTCAGKEHTFILDFQNTIEDIQNAFKPFYEATALEAISDPNQVYELEARIKQFSFIDDDEVSRFAEIYYRGTLDPQDRIALERLVRNAVQRFEHEDDEGRQEEFRQLLKSYMRFYSFVAQVMRLEDTGLEKLFAYVSWLSRLLPNREVPADIEITDDMIRLQAFKIEEKERGSASLAPGSTTPLSPIKEFGAKTYTEDEERALSEIIDNFNQRHGTQFTKEDFLRFEQVNRDILGNENLKDMLKNNPPDVVYGAFSQAFFEGAIKLFQRDNQLQNIVMTDSVAREQAIKHFFSRALREIREEPKQ